MNRLDFALSAGFFGIVVVSYGGLAGAQTMRQFIGVGILTIAFLFGAYNVIELKHEVPGLPSRAVDVLYWASLASAIGGWLIGYALGLTPMNT